MPKRQRKVSRRVQSVSSWQVLNQPVVEVSEDFAKNLLFIAISLLVMAWIAPYWGNNQAISEQRSAISYYPAVAGARISNVPRIPEWYYVAKDIPEDMASAFTLASSQVLDISKPAMVMADFYSPGLSAVKEAWLELMADPY